jgi:integrase
MPTMALLREQVGTHRLSAVSAAWADNWVADMKTRLRSLAPGTIRKRVGALARAIDAHWRTAVKGTPPGNPLRYMPRGYSQYDAASPVARSDEIRDRRMLPGELVAVRSALAGTRNPERERPLANDPAFALLFELILHTGLRLSEAYGLKASQVDTSTWVLRVDGSKGERGKRKPRVVPLVPELRSLLRDWCADRVGLVFPFWTGLPEDKRNATNRLSARFTTLFNYAGVLDFTEHDLRHEATCRWVTMRDAAGRWVFSELEICRIMGWSDPKMMLRYASLRGEDLSSRLG